MLNLHENQTLMTMNPTITIDLPPHLHDYLYHEFGTPRGEEAVRVTAAARQGKGLKSSRKSFLVL